jgi:CysZ protein
MLHAITLSFQSLSDRKILSILAKSVGLTLLVFAALGALAYYAIYAILGYWDMADGAIAGIGAAIFLVLTGAILFRVIAVAIIWIFADQIVDHVEDRYYPNHAARRATPTLASSIKLALRSAARALGYNMLALPFYLMMLFTGLGTPLLFLGVNAYLLGRDLQDMLIARHGPEHGSVSTISRFSIGALGSAAMLVPVVNLFIPVIATATVVHLVHGGAQNKGPLA